MRGMEKRKIMNSLKEWIGFSLPIEQRISCSLGSQTSPRVFLTLLLQIGISCGWLVQNELPKDKNEVLGFCPWASHE